MDIASPASPMANGGDDGGFRNALFNMPIANPIGMMGMAPDRLDVNGFDLRHVDQTIEVGMPPGRVVVVRGRFDLAQIRDVLGNQGFTEGERGGVQVLNGGDDFTMDVSQPMSRFWLGGAQNVAFLDDTTLAYAGSVELIEQTIAAAQGQSPSLSDTAAAYMTTPDALEAIAGGMLVPGTALIGGLDPATLMDPDVDGDAIEAMMATQAAAPALPPIISVLFCTTAGGPLLSPASEIDASPATPEPGQATAQAQIRVVFADDEAAQTAIPIIEERLNSGVSLQTQQPWSDVLQGWEIEAAGESLVVIRLGLPGNVARRVYNLLFTRDLTFLSWSWVNARCCGATT